MVAAKEGSVAEGTVRDVHLEHWEQQLASLKGQGAQVVAIVAQGRGKAEFGDFPTFEYVRDVLEKSGQAELVKLADSEKYSVVLSGHSGGGSTQVIPEGSSYTDPYRWLACVINEEIKSRVPDVHRDEVSDHFRIIEVAPPADGAQGCWGRARGGHQPLAG